MLNGIEEDGPSPYATAVEVDGIRRTLDQFMTQQETTNQKLQAGIDKILTLIKNPPIQHQPILPEDKGSTIKGKNIPQSASHQFTGTPANNQSPQAYENHGNISNGQNLQLSNHAIQTAPLDPTMMHHYTNPPQYHPYVGGPQYGRVYYYEEQFDPELDWQQHPWNIREEEAQMFPQTQQAHQKPPIQHQGMQDERRQQQNHGTPIQPPTYGMQLHQQHKMVARGPKLNFPEFIGEDADGWIRKCEKYFEMVGVPTEDRVKIAVMYINGKAEFWWRGTGCNANTLPWHQFCRMVTDRFNTTSEYEVVGQFHNLKQVGTVVDYVDRFEELVSMVKRANPSLNEHYYISSFISGLKDHIQYPLQCHQPTTLSQAYWYAKRLEQANPPHKKFTILPAASKQQKPWEKERDKEKPKETATQTIAELKAAGKCFKCREPWVPGHAKICKGEQLYSVILVENAEGREEVAVVEDGSSSEEAEFHDAQQLNTIQISMHALSGTPTKNNTFTLKLKIGSLTAIALIDSGSDASFINAKFAVKSKCSILEFESVRVAAANGQEMISNTACLDCPFTIQSHDFTHTLRLLNVQGYDVILGADWIYTHSPVALDLRKREFSICKDGASIVTFIDETIQHSSQVIGAKKLWQLMKKKAIGAVIVLNNSNTGKKHQQSEIPPEFQSILSEFEDVFTEPTQLPPLRSVDHAIPLLDDGKTVNQRPYRLPHHKKNAMEALIKQLLAAEMIRPSVSPYSSPVILVKKKDGTWRLCV